MNQKFTLIFLAAVLFSVSGIAQTIWDGPTITFTKANFADWTMADNQDRITDSVWITRADAEGIFNIVTESVYTDFSSPAGTAWAFGTTADIGSLTFLPWENTVMQPPNSVDLDMVLHLIAEDIYIDIKFTSWTAGNGMGQTGGGGFSYERSTAPVSNVTETQAPRVQVRPNPTSDYLYFENIYNREAVMVYDVLGNVVMNTRLGENGALAVNALENGVYYIRVEGFAVTKFLKI